MGHKERGSDGRTFLLLEIERTALFTSWSVRKREKFGFGLIKTLTVNVRLRITDIHLPTKNKRLLYKMTERVFLPFHLLTLSLPTSPRLTFVFRLRKEVKVERVKLPETNYKDTSE